jgi:alkylated DNA repair dioxygenase AlkB
VGIGNLLPSGGEVYYYPHFFSQTESDQLLAKLLTEIAWVQGPIMIYGRSIMQPRLTAWHGDEGKVIRYSGISKAPSPWTPTLTKIKERVESTSGFFFNGALLNFYRDQRDSVGWHRDDEKEFGPNPVIASVSLGETRIFQLRKYRDKKIKAEIELEHGSFLLMKGETQHLWEHCIPKRARSLGPRLNITFRKIIL